MSDNEKVFGTIDRSYKGNNGEKKVELRVSLNEFNGKQFVSIREWYYGDKADKYFPDKTKGMTIKMRELDRFIDSLNRLKAALGNSQTFDFGPPPMQSDDGDPVPF
jgi:hypothetical protein